jgi:uncharacterized membrane protein YoaK (UPF0700 family)
MKTQSLILLGGCSLSFGAAFANTGLVLQTGTSVSHLTGDIARMTMNIARWSPSMLPELWRVGVAAVGFFLGAVLAGFVIHHPTLNISRPYGRTITGIGLLLLAAFFSIRSFPLISIGLSALGCGLQNSLATHYRGIILRTTHLTGMMTDFGVTLGMHLRGNDVSAWKIQVPFLLIVSFSAGGLLAACLQYAGFDAIGLAGIGYVFAGLGWTFWKHRIHRSKKKQTRELDGVSDGDVC